MNFTGHWTYVCTSRHSAATRWSVLFCGLCRALDTRLHASELTSELQSEVDSESFEYIESGEIEGSSDSEEEHFLKVCRNKKRMRILFSSDSEDERTSIPSISQNIIGEIEIAIDGT